MRRVGIRRGIDETGTFYENTEILHVNTEPDRCYYLPCDAAGNSEQILLNGVWSFQYFPSVAEAEDFLRSEFDPKKWIKSRFRPAGSFTDTIAISM